MNTRRLSTIFCRLRLPAAFICALAALPMLWTGLDLPMPVLSGKALAGSVLGDGHAGNSGNAGHDGRDAALALMPAERVLLLQASVDSLALGLGGALAPEADEDDRRRRLAGALSALTASLGADIYFTAWQGTRILHAPANLDAGGLDFAAALDGRGAPFVLGMERLGRERGGFMRVLLPPQRRSGLADAGRVAGGPDFENDAAEILPPGPVYCPLDRAACPRGHKAPKAGQDEDVEQVVYVRGIPDSDWHIAAFLPAPRAMAGVARPQALPEAFSSVWQTGGAGSERRQERFGKGLRLSGFSLAGLAGLMLLCGARGPAGSGSGERKEGDGVS